MEVARTNYLPGDPRLIDNIVYELKSKGIFDNFRKECLSDVDTKPAYQNLSQRVEGSVMGFLKTQKWSPNMNKNQVREKLRKTISESGFLETGVERIVDQVVNPKINSIFFPEVESTVYRFLGIERPHVENSNNRRSYNSFTNVVGINDLLPNDLEAISPENEGNDKAFHDFTVMNRDSKAMEDKRIEEQLQTFDSVDEASIFPPPEESSLESESHLSGISDLTSHDSNHSSGTSKAVEASSIKEDLEISRDNTDTQLSAPISESKVSEATQDKMEISEDSNFSKGTSDITDSSSKLSFENIVQQVTMRDAARSASNSSENTNDSEVKAKKSDSKGDSLEKGNLDKHKSITDKHSIKDYKDQKSKKDNKSHGHKSSSDHRNRHTSKHSHEHRMDDREGKSSSSSGTSKRSDNKSDKEKSRDKHHSRNRHSSSSNSKDSSLKDSTSESGEKKHDLKTSESSRSKSPSKKNDSKGGSDKSDSKRDSSGHSNEKKVHDRSEKDSSRKHSSSSKYSKDKNTHESKDNPKHKSDSKTSYHKVDSKSSKNNEQSKPDTGVKKSYDAKLSKSEKHSSSNKKEKRDKERKRDKGDDHYNLKEKKSHRRSTDRDSSDGHSGTHSSSSSFAESYLLPQMQKVNDSSSTMNSGSNSRDSGNSDQIEVSSCTINEGVTDEVQQIKLIKPKFASNIFEARRLLKIRKKISKLEKQNQLKLLNNAGIYSSSVEQEKNGMLLVNNEKMQIDTSKKHVYAENAKDTNLKGKVYMDRIVLHEVNESTKGDVVDSLAKTVHNNNQTESEDSSSKLQSSVISKESWDMLEAKLNTANALVDYNSYVDVSDDIEQRECSIPNAVDDSVSSTSTMSPNSQCLEDQITKENDDQVCDAGNVQVLEKNEIEFKININEYDQKSLKNEEDTLEVPKTANQLGEVNRNCLFLVPEVLPETERYFNKITNKIALLEEEIARRTKLLILHMENQRKNRENENDVNKNLPKVDIVDVNTDSEILISPSKGITHQINNHQDICNNNKRKLNYDGDNETSQDEGIESTKLETTEKKPTSKGKKIKLANNALEEDRFSLPLSPADSEKSISSNSGKQKLTTKPTERRNSARLQSYTNADLYKPRPKFTSSRRRFLNNSASNDKN